MNIKKKMGMVSGFFIICVSLVVGSCSVDQSEYDNQTAGGANSLTEKNIQITSPVQTKMGSLFVDETNASVQIAGKLSDADNKIVSVHVVVEETGSQNIFTVKASGKENWKADVVLKRGYIYRVKAVSKDINGQKTETDYTTLKVKPRVNQVPLEDKGEYYVYQGHYTFYKADPSTHGKLVKIYSEFSNQLKGAIDEGSDGDASVTTKGCFIYKTWDGGVVPYFWLGSGITSDTKKMIKQAMKEIEDFCPGVKFVEKDRDFATEKGLRIKRFPDEKNDDHTTPGHTLSIGCSWMYEPIDKVNYWGNQLELKDWADIGTARHELLHVLGVLHEFKRWDRDKFVVVHTDNLDDPYQFEIDHDSDTYGTYDYLSIMHYQNGAGAKDPAKDTVTTIDPSKQYMIEYNHTNFSAGDKKTVKDMYKGTASGYWRDRRHDCVQWVERRHQCPNGTLRWVDRRHDCLRWVKVKKKIEWGGHWNTKKWPWKWVKEYKTIYVDELWNHKNEIGCGLKGWPHQELQYPYVINCGAKGWPHQELQTKKGVISCGQEGWPHQEYVW